MLRREGTLCLEAIAAWYLDIAVDGLVLGRACIAAWSGETYQLGCQNSEATVGAE